MKPARTYARRLRAAIAGIGVGALAFCASTRVNAAITWTGVDVGTPALKGSVTDNGDGTFTIQGGGDDIWNASDNCYYYYAWGSGTNWDAIVEITAFSAVDDWSKCELMVRVSDPVLGPQGPDAFVADMATGIPGPWLISGVVDQFRTAAGSLADWVQAGLNPWPIYPGTWMRISRNGSVFSIYYFLGTTSPVATDWNHYIDIDTSSTTFVGQDHGTTFGNPFPDIVAVGVAVTAHNDAANPGAVVTIANLSAIFPALPLPHPMATITHTGANVIISWTPNVGTLYASPAVAGPAAAWQPVANATNPMTIPTTGPAMYYRVR